MPAMTTRLARFILDRPRHLRLPVGAYAGLALTGATVRDVATRPDRQVEAVLALRDRFDMPAAMTAMDLSVEAETYGCEIRFSDDEIPTVVGRRATTLESIDDLGEPRPGDGRTAVALESTRRLARATGGAPVLGCMIGPFSLAGRIFGVAESLEATALDPDPVTALLERVTGFLAGYAAAFREAGAWGVVMAEPAAGLLSPAALGRFSAPYVRRIVGAVEREDFAVVLHNCGARIVHLPKVLESGAGIYHFGAPMDIVQALGKVGDSAILCGNLDPASVFHLGTPETVRAAARALLDAVGPRRNFVLSSGCDVPPGTPLANIEAFFAA